MSSFLKSVNLLIFLKVLLKSNLLLVINVSISILTLVNYFRAFLFNIILIATFLKAALIIVSCF